MPYAFVPPGYRAVLLGQAQDIGDLGTFNRALFKRGEGAQIPDILSRPVAMPVRNPGRVAITTSMPIRTRRQYILSGRRVWPGCRLSSDCWPLRCYRPC